MSFILDALKKSENERQRTVGPSLADAPVRVQQSERPWWVVAVAALLVVNLAVLLFVLMRDDNAAEAVPTVVPPPSATTSVIPPAVQAQVAPPAVRSNASPAVRSLAEEAGAPADSYYDNNAPFDSNGYVDPSHPELAAAANVPSGPPLVRPIAPPAVAPLASQPTFEARNNSGEVLPNASSLIASGTSLPDMRLDIHVYSNNPAERFVFINMRKYAEGQTLSEGPTVERITPEGAVLNQQGLRFVLPRQ